MTVIFLPPFFSRFLSSFLVWVATITTAGCLVLAIVTLLSLPLQLFPVGLHSFPSEFYRIFVGPFFSVPSLLETRCDIFSPIPLHQMIYIRRNKRITRKHDPWCYADRHWAFLTCLYHRFCFWTNKSPDPFIIRQSAAVQQLYNGIILHCQMVSAATRRLHGIFPN